MAAWIRPFLRELRGPFLDPVATDPHGSRSGRALDKTERTRLMLDGIVNNLSLVVSAAVGVLLVPVMLRGLGAESYGFWIIALSLPGMLGAIDLGLGIGVTMQVAAGTDAESQRRAARFVMAAGNAHMAMGFAVMAFICVIGLLPGNLFHLTAPGLHAMPLVFVAIGLSHVCERVTAFEGEVLWGLRRFDVTNSIAVAATLLEFGGIVAVIAAGKGLIFVAAWHAVVAAGGAVASYAAVTRLAPVYRMRPGRIEWDTIRPNVPFGLSTQLAEAARSLLWQTPPFIIGALLGSASVVPYHVGRRIPQMISMLYMRATGVFVPSLSAQARAESRAATREILEVGTRWTTIWTLPLCVVLWIVAPGLLQAWIGNVPPGTVEVLRLITAAVFAEAVAACSIQLLWARRAMRTIVAIPGAVVMASLVITLILMPGMGVVAAGWGLCLPMALGAAAFVHVGSRTSGANTASLLLETFDGLTIPTLLLIAVSAIIGHFTRPGWAGVIAIALGGGLGYLLGFYFAGAREEERTLIRLVVDAVPAAGRSLYRFVFRRAGIR
jgi:O-antigen/teichoic acid export membrane protein